PDVSVRVPVPHPNHATLPDRDEQAAVPTGGDVGDRPAILRQQAELVPYAGVPHSRRAVVASGQDIELAVEDRGIDSLLVPGEQGHLSTVVKFVDACSTVAARCDDVPPVRAEGRTLHEPGGPDEQKTPRTGLHVPH